MLLPILPVLMTHYFAMPWAYFWMLLPCFLAVYGIMCLLAGMMENHFFKINNVPKCCEVFVLVAVRCLLVLIALFVFQAPMEVGCFQYGYSLDEMPANRNEYTAPVD